LRTVARCSASTVLAQSCVVFCHRTLPSPIPGLSQLTALTKISTGGLLSSA
jgi:hypothetical protein